MEDELTSLLDMFHACERAGQSATLTMSAKGGKAKVKFETVLDNTKRRGGEKRTEWELKVQKEKENEEQQMKKKERRERELKVEELKKRTGDTKMRCTKEQTNRSLVEFMNRQIQELEEELECPVCFVVTTTAPIYKCPEDHLMCRDCRPKLSKCPECRVGLKGLPYKKFRGAERQAERLLKLREEKLAVLN